MARLKEVLSAPTAAGTTLDMRSTVYYATISVTSLSARNASRLSHVGACSAPDLEGAASGTLGRDMWEMTIMKAR